MIQQAPKKIFALRDNKIQELDDQDADVELISPNNFFSTHINLIPMHSAVQGPRLFYGARFYNQAMPLVHPDSPLVQNLDMEDKEGRSFDEKLGRIAGTVTADDDGEVIDLSPDFVKVKKADGSEKVFDLYNNFPFNRKSAITHTPLIKKGDVVTRGQILAKSNYTSDTGALALGANAKVGLVPFKGYSMDDAIVVSNSFAKRLTSDHSYTVEQDYDNDIKGGLNHFVSLFPTQFKKEQLKQFDANGVVKPGTVVRQGDPLILATRPRVFSSTTAQLGKLSKAMRQSRHDSSQLWDSEFDGVVTDVAKTKTGYKVIVKSEAPAQMGDKIVFRSGQKGVIANILSDDQMPRTKAGEALEVLLNPLGIPSRVNNGIIYELLLGKAAAKLGKPIKVPSFNKKGEKWYDFVAKTLQDAGLAETEEVFDPMSNRLLENPITVGVGHVLKLHHTSASKASARGQGGYDLDQQPLKGGSEAAQAKRLSGLEIHSLLSAGAYKTLKEGSTLRGQKNDEYWRALRQGYKPKPPGTPFVWEKFQTLLTGAGLHARKINGGKLRLGPFTDDELNKRNPMEIKSGDLVDMNTMDPIPGGLFDQSIVGNNRWGKISIPFSVPNPAFESSIRHLLGLTEKDLRKILSGEMELPPHLR
jgi:DNA-directed RNA polymerase subunit beta